MKIRVLLVEDHRMVREALCEVLTKVTDIEVVGEAGDAQEGLNLAKSLSPDVIVLDIRLPDLNGIEVAARLRDAGNSAKIVALSAFSDKRFVHEMLRSGASGYVTKSAAGTELVRAIRAVASGHGYFSPGDCRHPRRRRTRTRKRCGHPTAGPQGARSGAPDRGGCSVSGHRCSTAHHRCDRRSAPAQYHAEIGPEDRGGTYEIRHT